jgi:Cu2+-exporting ATPase
MLVEVLALGSAVALGSGLTFRRQNKSLTQKLGAKRALHQNAAPDSQPHASASAGRTSSKGRFRAGANEGRSARPGSRDLYQGAKKGFLALRKVFTISMGGTQTRDQHLRRLAAQNGNQGDFAAERKLDRKINLSIGLMGLAAVGTFFYAPFLRIAAAGTLYNYVPVFQELSKNLKRGRISTELLEVVSWISFLVSGYFFLATFVSFTALLNLKLLRRTEEHSHQQLIDSFSQKPHSIWVISEGAEVEIPLAAVRKQDIVVVNAGEMIPVDGIVVEGVASIDQHSLTGESKPVEKEIGEKVMATTLVLSGRILIQAVHTGSDTNAAKIEQILEQTQEFKESLRLRGKQIADGFIAPTLFVSSLTLPLLGSSAAMAILWSGFGYNMKLYGPISVLNFLHIMAKNGILIKDGRSLEMLQQIDTVVFDKTGTLTVEQPRLRCIYPLAPFSEESLLTYAAAAERRQSHPIAKAILGAAEQRNLELPAVEDAAYRVGYGIEVTLEAKLVQVGSFRFMQQKGIHVPEDVYEFQDQSEAKGNSQVFVAVNDNLAGVLELEPCIRSEARRIIEYLKGEGVGVSIISGDHEEPTRRLAKALSVDKYYAETLPTQKAELIAKLRANGRFVCYVGDGINDAIALKEANVSISLSGASSVAMDTAQIVLMDGDLNRLESLFEISKAFEKNMQSNYLNSMIPGVITLSGVFLLHMGLVGGLVVYFSSKLVGLMNCMMPLVKDEMKQSAPSDNSRDDKVDFSHEKESEPAFFRKTHQPKPVKPVLH